MSNCPVKTVAMLDICELISDDKVVVTESDWGAVLTDWVDWGLQVRTVWSTDMGSEHGGVQSCSLAESVLRGESSPGGGEPGADVEAGVWKPSVT